MTFLGDDCWVTRMQSKISLDESGDAPVDPMAIEGAAELFRTCGALWIENVFSKELIEGLAEAYHQRYTSRRVSELKNQYALVGDHRFMITVDIEAPFNDPEVFDTPSLRPLFQTLIGQQYLISSFGSVLTFPGADPQPIHFDHPPLFESESDCVGLPAYAITMVVPLVDLDESTGSTAIWEGTHRQLGVRNRLHELIEKPDWEGAAIPYAKKGDVYLMDYRVVHGGTANRSEFARPILYVVYCRPWFHDGFNFSDQPPVSISNAQLNGLPMESRRLFANVSFSTGKSANKSR